MPALQGAVALEQMDEVAVLIAEQLHFDMAGARDVLFEEHIGDAEGGAGLAAGLLEGVVELVGGQRDAHAAAAAAHRRLDDDGIAELFGELVRLLVRRDRRVAAGQDRHTRPAAAMCRATTLSPSCSRISTRGPTKMMPASSQARAKSAFSERKP